MLSNETISLIHLNLIQGVGLKTVQTLRKIFGSAEQALKATPAELHKVESLSPTVRDLLIRRPVAYSLEKELELIQSHGCQLVTLYDEVYPPLLRQIADPPLILYIKGELKPEDALSIAFVGSRQAKDYGRRISYQFSYQLAKRGVTVISGFAKGVDTLAHRGALEAGGRTVAVMGNGLSLIYPAVNTELAEQIEQAGALISEFPMSMEPIGRNFPRRNRIISGLSLGTVVVEASNRSGALITARLAAEQGREVFAVPGEIFSELSTGTHKLINSGATLINTVDDLIEVLPADASKMLGAHPASGHPVTALETSEGKGTTGSTPMPEPSQTDNSLTRRAQPVSQSTPESEKSEPVPAAPPPDLTGDEKTVFDAIETPSVHIDVIVRKTELPIGKVSSVLLMLELKGIVQQLPGKQFTKDI